MYYPYLRGKRFELKALRDYSAENPNEEKIIPIIEPVNESLNALKLAIDQMLENRLRFAIILNPNDGDFKHSTVSFDLISTKPELIDEQDQWIPAYLYQGDPSGLNDAITASEWDHVMLIFKTCVETDKADVMTLISNPKIETVVNNFGNMISRRIRKGLLDAGKSIVCLNDCFINQRKNADYANVEDEFFSEMFYYFRDEGFSGFADYTALPSEYIEGGMLPYALVIHLTYKRDEDQIYIHHFVSDHNFDQSNIRLKFNEAAGKIEHFFANRDRTTSVNELISRANTNDGYPGLGYLKELSVKNHLELVKRLIG
ncbi:MAG: sce7725 family protein [Bacteroidales bacterium]|jgi:hypothetical protein|nr:sce7725 family protein [Bacteroidales bacterium]MCI2121198.1 sce7725 family protein [Bacteroidales bacterium]MCI2145014.1 sce7725 family protein [Bacteroidales bacterium]